MRRSKKLAEHKFKTYPAHKLDTQYQNEELSQFCYHVVDAHYDRKNTYIHDQLAVAKSVILPSLINALFHKSQLTSCLVVCEDDLQKETKLAFQPYQELIPFDHYWSPM